MSKKTKMYTVVMSAMYGIALLACFICDLVLNGALTWFYIVFVSLIISFSITNIPFMVKRHKVVVSALSVTCFTYLLLYVCCTYVHGDWLFSFAYPIATYSFVVAWILLFVLRSRRINWGFKASLALLACGIFTLTSNLLIFTLSGDKFSFKDLFQYDGGVADYSANGIIFVCLMACSIISAGIGLILLKKKTRL